MPTDDERLAAVRAAFAAHGVVPYSGPAGTAIALTLTDAERVLGRMSIPPPPGPVETTPARP